MPWGLTRYNGSGHLHFITFSCYHRQQLLHTPFGRDLFLSVLERMRVRYRFVLLGYVVMPEHVHLLMSEPQNHAPSVVIQAVKLGFAQQLPPLELASARHLWQRRFYDFNVWSAGKRVEKLRYIHRNPVTRGLVTDPDHWPWSSFRAYRYLEAGTVKVNDYEVLTPKVAHSGVPHFPRILREVGPSLPSTS